MAVAATTWPANMTRPWPPCPAWLSARWHTVTTGWPVPAADARRAAWEWPTPACTLAWVAPSLSGAFSVEDYLVAALRRSLSGEIRPEQADHARTLVAAQMATLGPLYREVLNAEVASGRFVAEGLGRYRLRGAPSAWDRLRVRLYFHHSKVRATVRLLKHVVLYEGWLDYIVRKVERSGNPRVELTEREKRWPLIFLWSRVIRFIWTRPQKRQ